MLTFNAPLSHYNPNVLTIVAADTFNYGVGVVVSYVFPGGSVKVAAHFS